MYMDKDYGKSEHSAPKIYDLGVEFFRNRVVATSSVSRHVRNQLLDLIRREREGELIERRFIRAAKVINDVV